MEIDRFMEPAKASKRVVYVVDNDEGYLALFGEAKDSRVFGYVKVHLRRKWMTCDVVPDVLFLISG